MEKSYQIKCFICHHTEDRHREGTYGFYCTKCLGSFQPYSVGSSHQTFHKFIGDNLLYLEWKVYGKS